MLTSVFFCGILFSLFLGYFRVIELMEKRLIPFIKLTWVTKSQMILFLGHLLYICVAILCNTEF